jgi:hypothetical protein
MKSEDSTNNETDFLPSLATSLKSSTRVAVGFETLITLTTVPSSFFSCWLLHAVSKFLAGWLMVEGSKRMASECLWAT